MADREPTSASTGQLISQASDQLSDLVRSEMQLARTELMESVKHAGKGGGLFGAAGIAALYGLGVLIAAAVLGLSVALDAWLAALIVGIVLLAAAGVAALAGKREVTQATPPVQQTRDSVKADIETVKGHTSTSRSRT